MLEQAKQLKDEIIRLRRDIHQHPELSFQEVRTAKLVADTLTELGYDVQTGVGRTGVVAQIGTGEGPTIGLRAHVPDCGNLHTPTFAIDEDVLHLGTATLAEMARRFVTGQL